MINVKDFNPEKLEGERLISIAEMASLLGHPIRLKILSILIEREGAPWTDIVAELEKTMGRLNPNTVNFHLSKLILGGIIRKDENNVYHIKERVKENRIFKVMLAELKGGGSNDN
jgi:DNA-binding transcriptional ArsR family regulator